MSGLRVLILGESGSGKTGALASLLSAGYNLRVIDLDNGVETLVSLLTDSKSKYKKDSLSRLKYVTLTDPMRSVNGRLVPAKATVWQRAMNLLFDWPELGPVSKWGPNDILAIDTLGSLGIAARNFNLQLTGNLGKLRSPTESMRDIGDAQELLETFLQFLSDDSISCQRIVNTHIVYSKADGTPVRLDEQNPVLYGYPSGIGKAFSVKTVSKYFNHLLMSKSEGPTRRIYTKTQGNISLKSGTPLAVKDYYLQEFGLAEYFAAALGTTPDSREATGPSNGKEAGPAASPPGQAPIPTPT